MFFLIFENSVLGVLGVCEHHPFVYIYMSVAHPILLRQSHLCVCVNRTVVRIGRKNITVIKKVKWNNYLVLFTQHCIQHYK